MTTDALKYIEIVQSINYIQREMFNGRCVDNCLPKKICVTCGNPAKDFREDKHRKEYTLSGMCQICQDGFFR